MAGSPEPSSFPSFFRVKILVFRHGERLGRVPPEVIVGEEEDRLASLEVMREQLPGVARGADGAARGAGEGLHVGIGVHVGQGDQGELAGRANRGEGRRGPGAVDHVGHGAGRRRVGDEDPDPFPRKDRRALGHESDPRQDDVLRPCAAGLQGQLVGVADEVGLRDYLGTLVMVGGDDHRCAELASQRGDIFGALIRPPSPASRRSRAP